MADVFETFLATIPNPPQSNSTIGPGTERRMPWPWASYTVEEYHANNMAVLTGRPRKEFRSAR